MREIGRGGFGEKVREWNGKELNQQWRDKWAELGSRYLEKAGFAKEAERYSYAQYDLKKQRQIALERGDLEHARALDREATTHMGPHVAAMERKGIETERGKIQQQEFAASHELTKLKQELAQVNAQLREAERPEQRKPQRDPQTRPSEPKRTAPEPHFKDAAHGATRNAPAPNIPSGVPSALHGGTADAKKVIRVAHRALGKGVNLVGGTVSAFTKAFESLFTPPPKPLTRAQIEEQNKRRDNAARDHAEVAGKQILFDVQQERIDNAARERADADRQRDSENWRKQQDRGGRER
jgi:hypothetical protein